MRLIIFYILFSISPLSFAQDVSFGFTNEAGDRLLVADSEAPLKNPEQMNEAICEKGGKTKIKFIQLQKASADDTGRDTQYNFNSRAGHLFELTNKVAEAGETCMIVKSDYLKNRNIVKLSTPEDKCSQDMLSGIERNMKGWKVKKCVGSKVSNTQNLILVEFAKKKADVLASIVLQDDRKFYFQNFEAKAGGGDCWRVDDGCEFNFDSFTFSSALVAKDGVQIFYLWAGAEGQNAYLLGKDGEAKLKPLVHGYRYWSPM